MDPVDTLRLLRSAHDEIVTLRKNNTELGPRAHAYDTLAIIARLSLPPASQGYGEDVAWRLKKAVEELEAERKAEMVNDDD